MGTRRIKLTRKSKPGKAPEFSPRQTMHMILEGKKEGIREKDNEEVVALIVKEVINLEMADNYKYIQTTAKEMGWTVGRLNKTLDRVKKLLKEEKKAKEKKQNERS